MELRSLKSQSSVQLKSGLGREICKKFVVHIERFQTATEYTLLVEAKHCELIQHYSQLRQLTFRPTEVWSKSDDNDDINIKVTEPSLHYYRYYPELFIVDSKFCTNN